MLVESSPRIRDMRRLSPLLLLALVAFAGCADEGPVAGPATMTATLRSPNGAEGAAVVLLVGDGVGTITPVGGTEVYSHTGGSTTQVVLINQAGGELSFQVAVADATQPPEAVVQQVAGPDDALRPTLVGYALEIVR
jgi:hypothetical protein